MEGATQLHQYMSNHELHESVQSGFRTHHRTETTLIKIANDIMTDDFGHISILKFPDLSAAFGTCSHTIQLSHISRYLVLTGTVISCFQSYLSNPTHFVRWSLPVLLHTMLSQHQTLHPVPPAIASEHGCHLTYFSINSNKTDLLVLAPKALLWKTGVPLIVADRRLLSLSPEVHNQGVVLDSAL